MYNTRLLKQRLFTTLTGALALMLPLLLASPAHADQKKRYTLAEQLIHDVKDGKVKADNNAVKELIVNRNIPISYQYINTLMNTPNAFGSGVACVLCHSSQDAAKSYRGLDLSSCKGMREGSTEEPRRAIFTPGSDATREILGRRLRNNRMSLGVGFHMTTDTQAVATVKEWIATGAKNDQQFNKNVLPLFNKSNVFAPNTPACTACHMSNQEPPSFHELNLRSYKGIMLGADSVAKGVDKASKVVIPGEPELSAIFQHLTEDRMPPGISPSENRDHPNTLILLQWIAQGANCQ